MLSRRTRSGEFFATLPLDERSSALRRQRDERNQEYNQLLLRRSRSAPHHAPPTRVTSPDAKSSLPIRERDSAQRRLREERNQEDNRLLLRAPPQGDAEDPLTSSPEAVSLPIKDRSSAQLRKREERNREYNAMTYRAQSSNDVKRSDARTRLKPAIRSKPREESRATQTPDGDTAKGEGRAKGDGERSDWLEEVVEYVKVCSRCVSAVLKC